jgi:hypothetical protein
MDVRDQLPPGNFTVCKHPLTGEYYLEESEAFVLPKKLYGKTERYGRRILDTFYDRQPGTQVGVFLSGLKGSGKTLLAKYVAVTSGLPTIIVNTPFSDERFMRTIQGIEQAAVVIFDEFEKLYDEDAQESILTLFDGVYTAQNKVMVITCNDRYKVKGFFHNRPSRLRYAISYDRLDTEFIREYCEDKLQDCGKYLEKITTLSALCDDFNFDMLQVLVDELNRYGGEFDDAIEVLNVKPAGGNSGVFWVPTVTTPKQKGRKWKPLNTRYDVSPIYMISNERYDNNISLRLEEEGIAKKATDDDGDEWAEADERMYLELRQEHLFQVDPNTGTYVFRVQDYDTEFEVVFTEVRKGGGLSNYSFGRGDF